MLYLGLHCPLALVSLGLPPACIPFAAARRWAGAAELGWANKSKLRPSNLSFHFRR